MPEGTRNRNIGKYIGITAAGISLAGTIAVMGDELNIVERTAKAAFVIGEKFNKNPGQINGQSPLDCPSDQTEVVRLEGLIGDQASIGSFLTIRYSEKGLRLNPNKFTRAKVNINGTPNNLDVEELVENGKKVTYRDEVPGINYTFKGELGSTLSTGAVVVTFDCLEKTSLAKRVTSAIPSASIE